MEFQLGFEYIMTAIRNWQEEKIYLRWINGFQQISFDEFKKQMGQQQEVIDNRSEEEILERVKDILNRKVVL
jgi:hypothetical protein